MSADANKAIVRRFYKEVFEQGKLSLADELFSADYVNDDPHGPPGGWPRGPQGVKMIAASYREAFPDITFAIDEQLSDGDQVVTRWSSGGTNSGPLMGMPASGKKVRVACISIERIANGKIAATHVNFDMLGLLQQVGAIPAPESKGL